jgi:hypothetical protein
MYVMTGKARANMDKAIVRIPKPICTILSQLGDLLEYIARYNRDSIARHKNIKKVDSEKSSTSTFLSLA